MMDTVRKYTRTFLVNPRLTRGGGNLKIKLNDEKQGREEIYVLFCVWRKSDEK